MAIQLILFPQVYDGYYSYTVSAGATSTGGGTNPTGGGTTTPTPTLSARQSNPTQILGSPRFQNGLYKSPLSLDTGMQASNILNLRKFPAPIGRWRTAGSTNIPSANKPNIIKGKLHLGTATTNCTSAAYTTVNTLQAGNAYRVLVTIDSAPAGNLILGTTGGTEWTEEVRMTNSSGDVGQLGGRVGTVNGLNGWIDADTGVYVGNPLKVALTSQKRFYQNFVAERNQEVLQLSYIGSSSTNQAAVISVISVVATNTNATIPNNGNTSNGNATGNNSNNHTGGSTGMTITNMLMDGQVIVDLYTDASIPLNLSVDNFINVDEKVASYSKSFLCPATKRNNIIFSHYFDVTRTQNHDPYVFNPFAKTKAIIKDDTITIFEGWMRLINVQEKNGEISYNINLYSEPTTFCDFLKARTIANMDLSELGHLYNWENVEKSWQAPGVLLTAPLLAGSYAGAVGAMNTEVLKYPFINWTGRYEMGHLHKFSGVQEPKEIWSDKLENSFRPVIQCKYLLDRMFADTNFTYTSNFLNGAMFKKLFMDFNFGGEDAGLINYWKMSIDEENYGNISTPATGATTFEPLVFTDVDEESPSGSALTNYNPATGEIAIPYDGEFYVRIHAKFFRDYMDMTGEVQLSRLDTLTGITVNVATYTMNDLVGASGGMCPAGSGIINPNTIQCTALRAFITHTVANAVQTDKYFVKWRCTGGNPLGAIIQSNNDNVTFNYTGVATGYGGPSTIEVRYTGGDATLAILMQGKRGTMKQYDFWAGLKEMFNLVTMPDKTQPGNLLIEPYGDIFLNNPDTKQLDWTNKIDISNIKHEPLNKLPRVTNFTYLEDPKDFRVGKYKRALAGYLYGTKTYEAGQQFFSILAGTKSITAKPFAPTLCAPINSNIPDLNVSHIYSANDEGTEFSAFDNKPRILFDNGIQTIGGGYTWNSRDSVFPGFHYGIQSVYGDQTLYLQMTHLSDCPAFSGSYDLNYGECPLVAPTGTSPAANLFNLYWKPYYDEAYNPDARVLKLKANLTPQDVAQFNFYDHVYIKNRTYRVNKINYNAGELAKLELILIT